MSGNINKCYNKDQNFDLLQKKFKNKNPCPYHWKLICGDSQVISQLGLSFIGATELIKHVKGLHLKYKI